jgi:hypothetical protein
VPDTYEVLRNGTEVASVPGSTTDYTVAGLKPAMTYRLSVVAVRGGRKSPASTVTVQTAVPSLADAVLRWSGRVDVTDVVGNFTENFNTVPISRSPGDSWTESWSFTPECSAGPCKVRFHGNDIGNEVTVSLVQNGSTYSGNATENGDWDCGSSTSDPLVSNVYVTVKAAGAGMKKGVWTVTSFTATVIWDVSADAAGNCSPVSDQVQGTSS